MKKRILSFLLATLMLGSFVACTQPTTPPADTDGTTAALTEGNTTNDATVPDTEPDTEPPYDWSTWEPAVGADVTELSISGTKKPTDEEKTQSVTYTYKKDDMNFGVKNGEATGTSVTLKGSTVSSDRKSVV